MELRELWQTALGEIEVSISEGQFITWFKNTQITSKKNGVITIKVPNAFSKDWLETKYNKLILKTLRNLSPDVKEISLTISPLKEFNLSKLKNRVSIQKKKPTQKIETFGISELEINKETNLNPKYNFNNFIIGSFNELAHAAAKAICTKLGTLYNPLFIYGGTGLGKTHLIQAVGNEINKHYPNKKVKYLTSEKFTEELVSSLRNKRINDFKNKYRKIDTLIIDDIQFIGGKEKTQEEFFHTFNALYEKNKQIIISSDRPPKAISTLEERLRSRFEGGMIADISFPDYETRLAILKSKLDNKKIDLNNEIIEYIALNIQNNIRELEGALNRIIIKLQVNPELEVNPEIIKKLLNDLISAPKKIVNHKNIIKIISDFYNINQVELLTNNRKKSVVYPRQIMMYLLREDLKNSFPYIAEVMGKKDHTTVIYACQKIKNELKNNEILSQELNLIRNKIYNYQ